MNAIRMTITGVVQGVNFRNFAKKNADRLGISGSAENLSDGNLEIFAKGERLDEFVQLMSEGPANAAIEDVKIDLIDDFDAVGFEIVY